MKKISEKGRKLSGVKLTENGLTFAFRSGGVYEVTKNAYVAALNKQFARLFPRIDKEITRERNERIKAEAEANGRVAVLPPPCVTRMFDRRKAADAAAGRRLLAAAANRAWKDFEYEWGDMLKSEIDSALDDAGIGGTLEDYLMRHAYTQDGRPLAGRRSGIDVYMSKGANLGYWYTEHETVNGFEIWYKAVDPFIWFGEKKESGAR